MPLLDDPTTLAAGSSSGALSSTDEINRLRLVLLRTARNIRTHSLGDVTQSQAAVLATLWRHGESTIGQIAEHEHVQPPSASRIVSRLEQLGLVVRRTDGGDRRRAVIALNAAGEEYLTEVRRAGTSWLGERLADLDEDELDRLGAALPVLERLLAGEP
ncbi:MarR family winged helix-turn-helix transcriptional regulator [Ilumatobacter nonamiensis]|uniref:MarR family winged helix-turn-helix transcriptional regulator n=1 Tax=Ilumatobacter nonamiensis TaxID=467093 RepID=UPI0003464724|nr:MarR family transcriptional regulator [Ilumatobacter nonamiensis]